MGSLKDLRITDNMFPLLYSGKRLLRHDAGMPQQLHTAQDLLKRGEWALNLIGNFRADFREAVRLVSREKRAKRK